MPALHELNGSIVGRVIRFMFDAGMAAAVIVLAFSAGKLTQRVDDMGERFGIVITIEAHERVTKLEVKAEEHERRLDRLERK